MLGKVKKAINWRYERWSDNALDRRFGIDTSAGGGSAYQTGSTAASPISTGIQLDVFSEILDNLTLPPTESSFVEFGCGKGRALILAAESGFSCCAGLEFDEAQYQAASSNTVKYKDKSASATTITISHGNVADFAIPEGPLVIFLSAPFHDANTAAEPFPTGGPTGGPNGGPSDAILEQILLRIETTTGDRSDRIQLVSRNLESHALLDSARWLEKTSSNSRFTIYDAVSTSRSIFKTQLIH